MSILKAKRMTLNEARTGKEAAVPTLHLVAYRNTTINGKTVNYWVAEKLVVGAYASGRTTTRFTGNEKNVKINEIRPIAALMDIKDPMTDEVLENQLVIDAKYAKANKPKKTAPLITYYLAMRDMSDKELVKTQRAFSVGNAVDETVKRGEDNSLEIEWTDYDAKITAYVEAAGLHGFRFTGVKVFGLHLGGVYKKIVASETTKIEKAAKTARKDFKSDEKLAKKSGNTTKEAKEEFVDDKDETKSNDPKTSKDTNQSTPNVDPTSENVGKEGAATAAPETPKAEPVKEEPKKEETEAPVKEEAKVETPKAEEPKKEEAKTEEPVKTETKVEEPKVEPTRAEPVTEETPKAESKKEEAKAEPVKEEAKAEEPKKETEKTVDELKATKLNKLAIGATYKDAKDFILDCDKISLAVIEAATKEYGEASAYANVFRKVNLSIKELYTLLSKTSETDDTLVSEMILDEVNRTALLLERSLTNVSNEKVEKQQENTAKKQAKASKKSATKKKK